EFNSMAESLLRYQTDLKRMTRLAALSRFASLVSHEIRNPLNSMNINMQLLKRLIYRDDVSPERKAKYLEIISSEITRINDLVNNFLAIARPPELNLVQTNVHKILDDVVSIQNAHAVSEGIKIRCNYVDGDVYGMYDYNQLKQVFHNVIINAIDSMPEGGELNISTRIINKNARKEEDDIYISLQFSDTGIGINQDLIKDVFEFYFTTKPTGSGLGLAIAKQIVEGHNGQISLDSKEGRGTTVFIELPVKEYRLRKPDSMVEKEQQNNN
ncbi:MAG: PAS domain-containing sensor histidine kinase, partial [Calditrichia bacterium]